VALAATVRNEQLKLSACSRWPERHACPQECLAQIEEAPKACLVWTIINRWYQGQECVYCHKPFGEIHWHDHPLALLNRERKTVQWNEIPAENLQAALGTHQPVCFEPSSQHFYQPLWTLMGAGVVPATTSSRSEARYIPKGVRWIQHRGSEVASDQQIVTTESAAKIGYDFLVVATGAQLNWNAIPRLEEAILRGARRATTPMI
jgi:hypothetical protein